MSRGHLWTEEPGTFLRVENCEIAVWASSPGVRRSTKHEGKPVGLKAFEGKTSRS